MVLLESVLPLDQFCSSIPLSVLLVIVLLDMVLLVEASCNEIPTPLPANVLFEIVILEELYMRNPNERFPDKILLEKVLPLKFSMTIPAQLVAVFLIKVFLTATLDQFLR